MNPAQQLADEIKRLADDLQARSRDCSKRKTVDKIYAAIDRLRAMVPPQPTEPLTGTESPDYTAGWKAGYKHGAWGDKLEPLTISQIWDNQTIMALNAKLELQMNVLVEVVRAVEKAHGIGITVADAKEGGNA